MCSGTLALARGLNADAHLTIRLTDPIPESGQRRLIEAQIRELALTQSVDIAAVDGPGSFRRMLAKAHALVDVEGPENALRSRRSWQWPTDAPCSGSREQFAKILDAAPLGGRFAQGHERQLAERMKSLATAWGEELDSTGQMLRNAVMQEHSAVYWAEAVDSIVGFVRRRSQVAHEPVAWVPSAESVASSTNGSAAPTPSSEQPEPDAPEDALHDEGSAEAPSDTPQEDLTVGTSRWRRRRSRRPGNR